LRERLRTITHDAKRVAQSPGAFANWPRVLGDMARERFGGGPSTLSFATRTGLRIDCPNRPGARVPIYEIFAEDCYRFAWFLGPLLSRPIQVIDIGGHVGTFSCRLGQLHAGARVQAFEPSATTAAFLRGNVLRNGFADRVSVHEVALAATTGFAVFDDNGAGSGLNGLAAAGHAAGTATKVETVAFDDIIATTNAPVDLVKIDCEGGEYDLVLGSSPDSWANVQRVVIEWHPVDGHEWAELRDWFATAGLQVQDEDAFGRHGCVWLSREPLPPFVT
jgi:FkbM family methyltransferase